MFLRPRRFCNSVKGNGRESRQARFAVQDEFSRQFADGLEEFGKFGDFIERSGKKTDFAGVVFVHLRANPVVFFFHQKRGDFDVRFHFVKEIGRRFRRGGQHES